MGDGRRAPKETLLRAAVVLFTLAATGCITPGPRWHLRSNVSSDEDVLWERTVRVAHERGYTSSTMELDRPHGRISLRPASASNGQRIVLAWHQHGWLVIDFKGVGAAGSPWLSRRLSREREELAVALQDELVIPRDGGCP